MSTVTPDPRTRRPLTSAGQSSPVVSKHALWQAVLSHGKSPRMLVAYSLVLALLALAVTIPALQHGGTAYVVAVALWVLCGALSFLARSRAGQFPLDEAQRDALLDRLGRLEPLDVRVFAVNKPGSNGLGSIQAGTLELSNVDLTDQFANLITTQRSFQAASRLVTVSDSVLEDIVNLKQR